MSATAGNIVTWALRKLEEDPDNPIFWTRAELLQLVNDGFLEFTLLAGQLTSERTYTLIGAKLQSVPVGAIAIIHIAYANEKVEKTTVEHFDRANINWNAQSGILQKWAPCGLDRWFCDRHPTSSLNVKLTTLDEPTALGENDEIDLAPEYIEALTNYVFHFARFKEAGAELEQSMENYDAFLDKAGLREQKQFSEQWLIWSRDPDADTGSDYSTLDRS
jgi:hypothetical protein